MKELASGTKTVSDSDGFCLDLTCLLQAEGESREKGSEVSKQYVKDMKKQISCLQNLPGEDDAGKQRNTQMRGQRIYMRNEQRKSNTELGVNLFFCMCFLQPSDKSICLLSNILAFCFRSLSQVNEHLEYGSDMDPPVLDISASEFHISCFHCYLANLGHLSSIWKSTWNTVCSFSHYCSAVVEFQQCQDNLGNISDLLNESRIFLAQ